MHLRTITLVLAAVVPVFGQLTMDQKISDFQEIAGIYAKQYAPHDWKKQAFGVDLLDTAKWLDRVRATKDDLEFVDVVAAYIGQLNDAHDYFENTSNFTASLGFSVDIYDGKLLVDGVNHDRLSPSQYPIALGYELVSIDGKSASALLDSFMVYAASANTRSTRRFAASFLTFRRQSIVPTAPSVPDISTVVFKRFDGKLETYRIPWYKEGVPMTSIGKYPGYTGSATVAGARKSSEEDDDVLAGAQRLAKKMTDSRLRLKRAVVGFGDVPPVFVASLPPGFTRRLGGSAFDPFYSGTFTAGAYRVGYIRIPDFDPLDPNTAVSLFAREIAFFQDNTDGLIIDVMRNPGGDPSYAGALMSYVMFYPYKTMGMEVRVTSTWIVELSSYYEQLKAAGLPAQTIQPFKDMLDALIAANRANRTLTEPLPWDFSPGLTRQAARDQRGNLLAYTKPVMLLADEMSASAAEGFAGIIQDNGRGPIFGVRTMGAGGSVTGMLAGTYSLGFAAVTQSLMSRVWERAEAGGYPVSRYIENVGVHPEIDADYMTFDNLIKDGKPFVDQFVGAIADHIRKNR